MGETITIREVLEQRECKELSVYAAHSNKTKGRRYEESLCDIRTEYQRDRDRILHCKAFRRLKHKTQVFLSPEGDHYRTRLTHTLEVAQIGRTIAKALFLNEDLTEAIALGHDLGHTPFGHAGERALNEVCPFGFSHQEQSIRVVEILEKNGKGLNLTEEVKDGIYNHQTKSMPCTLEGKIVRLSDKIAYINHDIADAVRAGIIEEKDIPEQFVNVLGREKTTRLNTLIHDVIKSSFGAEDIKMSEEIQQALYGLREFLFENVYRNPIAKREEEKAIQLVQQLYEYYLSRFDLLPQEYIALLEQKQETKERVVCDYVAGMTDNYAIKMYTKFFVPKVWK